MYNITKNTGKHEKHKYTVALLLKLRAMTIKASVTCNRAEVVSYNDIHFLNCHTW